MSHPLNSTSTATISTAHTRLYLGQPKEDHVGVKLELVLGLRDHNGVEGGCAGVVLAGGRVKHHRLRHHDEDAALGDGFRHTLCVAGTAPYASCDTNYESVLVCPRRQSAYNSWKVELFFKDAGAARRGWIWYQSHTNTSNDLRSCDAYH
jgi:hypothetical protein